MVLSDNVPNVSDVFIPLKTTTDKPNSPGKDMEIFNKILKKQTGVGLYDSSVGSEMVKILSKIAKGTVVADAEKMWQGWTIGDISDETMKQAGDLLFDFEFASKSPIVKYQIFRLDSAPTGYVDFEKAKMFEVEKINGVEFVDTIKPNTTYYYTFRTINAHGYPSRPSPVREVNVYDDGDIHIGDTKPYAFPIEKTPQPVFKPLTSNGVVAVGLSSFQAEPYNVDGYGDKVEKNDSSKKLFNRIGLTGEGLKWTDGTRYFKIRVRSKMTGREIDLNFFPKIKKLDTIGGSEQTTEQIKAKGYSGGDFKELSNYFALSTKGLNALIKKENETSVDPKLIEAIIKKIKNNKLDQQALETLIANFNKLTST